MYFDDANLVDSASSEGSGQWACGQLNKLALTPFADKREGPCEPQDRSWDWTKYAWPDVGRRVREGLLLGL